MRSRRWASGFPSLGIGYSCIMVEEHAPLRSGPCVLGAASRAGFPAAVSRDGAPPRLRSRHDGPNPPILADASARADDPGTAPADPLYPRGAGRLFPAEADSLLAPDGEGDRGLECRCLPVSGACRADDPAVQPRADAFPGR